MTKETHTFIFKHRAIKDIVIALLHPEHPALSDNLKDWPSLQFPVWHRDEIDALNDARLRTWGVSVVVEVS